MGKQLFCIFILFVLGGCALVRRGSRPAEVEHGVGELVISVGDNWDVATTRLKDAVAEPSFWVSKE